MKLDDVGLRSEHYLELLDLWEEGLEVLQRMNPGFKGGIDQEREKDLGIAIRILRKHFDNMADYDNLSSYRTIEEAHKSVDKEKKSE